MKPRLPNLPALLAFESAARLESFSAAAAELDLSPATVNHRVTLLETQLSCLLFERLPHKLKLTDAGKSYLPTVRKAFDDLSVSTVDQLEANGLRKLSIRVPVSFGLLWLAPRLYRFREKHPQISVSFATSSNALESSSQNADVEIRFGLGHWDGVRSVRFFNDTAIVVCNPRTEDNRGRTTSISSFNEAELICVESMPDLWQRLCCEYDENPVQASSEIMVDSSAAALELACYSDAYAIVPAMLAREYLDQGKLVRAFQGEVKVQAAYYFVESLRGHATSTEAKLFNDWLREEIKQSRQQQNEASSNIASLTDRLQQ